MIWTDKVTKYLKKYWNIDQLKDKQIEVINELLLGNDVVGLLPTGYGKSMCYLIPPLISKKVMFIISPLISLMDEQKSKLDLTVTGKTIPSCALNMNNKHKARDIQSILDGNIKIVFMSPEYLIKGDGLDLAEELINKQMLGFLAVDESHCVSGWGQDFRADYVKIKIFRECFPDIPIVALTATATTRVCDDIIKLLSLDKPSIIRASFDRPNLFLKVNEISLNKKTNPFQKEKLVHEYVKKYNNSKIIIYTHTRLETEDLSCRLNKMGLVTKAYHAGLNKNIREEIQKDFYSNNELNIIISTIAFGMGIDQIVRCVIIFGFPSSIEEYFQQIGRGGRDGLICETILFHDTSSYMKRLYSMKDIKDEYPDLYASKLINLNMMKQYINTKICRRRFILDYFDDDITFVTCKMCDNCNKYEHIDISNIIISLNKTTITTFTRDYLTTDLNLTKLILKWIKYIKINKIDISKLDDSMKFKIPKIYYQQKQETFENKIDNYIKKYDL